MVLFPVHLQVTRPGRLGFVNAGGPDFTADVLNTMLLYSSKTYVATAMEEPTHMFSARHVFLCRLCVVYRMQQRWYDDIIEHINLLAKKLAYVYYSYSVGNRHAFKSPHNSIQGLWQVTVELKMLHLYLLWRGHIYMCMYIHVVWSASTCTCELLQMKPVTGSLTSVI